MHIVVTFGPGHILVEELRMQHVGVHWAGGSWRAVVQVQLHAVRAVCGHYRHRLRGYLVRVCFWSFAYRVAAGPCICIVLRHGHCRARSGWWLPGLASAFYSVMVIVMLVLVVGTCGLRRRSVFLVTWPRRLDPTSNGWHTDYVDAEVTCGPPFWHSISSKHGWHGYSGL